MLTVPQAHAWIKEHMRCQDYEEPLGVKEFTINPNADHTVHSVDFHIDVYVHKRLKSGRIDIPMGQVEGSFACVQNGLTTCENLPMNVHGDCDISQNPIMSLLHAPTYVKGQFNCEKTAITSLAYVPACKELDVSHTPITNFEHVSDRTQEIIGWHCDHLVNLQGITSHVKDLDITWNPNLHVLRGLQAVKFILRDPQNPQPHDPVHGIIQPFVGKGKASAIACAAALARAGFKGNARW
jgi:hypothetical protein